MRRLLEDKVQAATTPLAAISRVLQLGGERVEIAVLYSLTFGRCTQVRQTASGR